MTTAAATPGPRRITADDREPGTGSPLAEKIGKLLNPDQSDELRDENAALREAWNEREPQLYAAERKLEETQAENAALREHVRNQERTLTEYSVEVAGLRSQLAAVQKLYDAEFAAKEAALRQLAALRAELARAKASDNYSFSILKKCHKILEMKNDESYSLIPGEIEEWLCSHKLVKSKECAATDRAVMLRLENAALRSDKERLYEACTTLLNAFSRDGDEDLEAYFHAVEVARAAIDAARNEVKP